MKEKQEVVTNRGEDKLQNVSQAAELLGISTHTIYAWVCQRKIPYVKIGRRVMFRPQDIEAWIEGHRVPPAPPMLPLSAR